MFPVSVTMNIDPIHGGIRELRKGEMETVVAERCGQNQEGTRSYISTAQVTLHLLLQGPSIRSKAIRYQGQVAPVMLKKNWCSRKSSDLGPVLSQTSDASSATCYWCHLGMSSDDLYEMGVISFPIKALKLLLYHMCP